MLLQLCNVVFQQITKEKWIKGCILPFSRKGDLGITKNYRGTILTDIAGKVYNVLLLNHIKSEIEKTQEKSEQFLEKAVHSFRDSDSPSNHQRMCEKSQGNSIIHRFLLGFCFHTQRKDGANTTSIWSATRNCYRYNEVL